MFGIFGRFSLSGCRAIIQRRGPEFSRHHVSIGIPRTSITITAACMNATVQSESKSGPTHIKVWWNPGMICPVTGNLEGSWGKFNYPVPMDCWDWPVAVHTVTFGAERLTLTMGASAEK